MRIGLVKGRTWLQSLNTMAKCGTILLCHILPFRSLHLPNPPPPPPRGTARCQVWLTWRSPSTAELMDRLLRIFCGLCCMYTPAALVDLAACILYHHLWMVPLQHLLCIVLYTYSDIFSGCIYILTFSVQWTVLHMYCSAVPILKDLQNPNSCAKFLYQHPKWGETVLLLRLFSAEFSFAELILVDGVKIFLIFTSFFAFGHLVSLGGGITFLVPLKRTWGTSDFGRTVHSHTGTQMGISWTLGS